MLSELISTLIFIQNPDTWKEQSYDKKYNQIIQSRTERKKSLGSIYAVSGTSATIQGTISWYASGKYKDGTEFKGDKSGTACFKKDRFKRFELHIKTRLLMFCVMIRERLKRIIQEDFQI